ncbi:hypothetical protein ZEAMMB73_Zm00001d036911 [Zea mays]|uniref:At1g61320/AtMIF1 LRR domain-containing protein n=1 Tax=Zea mays TaxID=4577 RepID=A0A1D6LSE7_MAIZE|nr:hypothetical protein ZEAMMB73_Zm00001d036911 [Zea mays]
MPLRDCNVLIRTLARRGSFSRVMAVYYDLRARGLAADSYTYPFVLMAISTMKLSVEGRKVHAAAVKTGFRWDAYTTCSLMEMYTMLGRRVFDKMPQRFLVLWNMMMSYKEKRSCQHNDDSKGEQEKPFLSESCLPFIDNEGPYACIGMKALKIHVPIGYTAKDSRYLNRWLQIAITHGIEELELIFPFMAKYKFPYSLLPMSGDSIKCLELSCCSFCPTSKFGWLKNLTKLCLDGVFIEGDELERLVFSALALERLEIRYCDRIVCLKVPSMLQRLTYLEVYDCDKLRVLDIDAPNITCFNFGRHHTKTKLSIGGGVSKIKELSACFDDAVYYVRVELPSMMANLETLTINSMVEMNIPMLPSKYLHLKYLKISLAAYTFPSTFDYFSLASFFDACPSLEAFFLDAYQRKMKHVSIITNPLVLRGTPEQRHHKLKTVEMNGFTSAKSLVELACHIAQCATSLQSLKLEVHQSDFKCYIPANKHNKCSPLPVEVLMESRRAHLAIMTYIEPIIPSTVKLQVVGPCSRCHALEQ